MKQHSKTWSVLALALVTPLLVLDGWLFNIAQAIEVEIELTIRDSQYTKRNGLRLRRGQPWS
jgi:hypothetical protein